MPLSWPHTFVLLFASPATNSPTMMKSLLDNSLSPHDLSHVLEASGLASSFEQRVGRKRDTNGIWVYLIMIALTRHVMGRSISRARIYIAMAWRGALPCKAWYSVQRMCEYDTAMTVRHLRRTS